MKKYVVWILMIAMTLSLCACRPEAQTGDAGSPTESVGETEENVGQGAEVDENAEDTETGAPLGEEGEESAENTLLPEESEEGTEITETVPAENEEEAEVTLPATTTEDPALRAEADRIRKEQGEAAYQDYCFKKDITSFGNYTIDQNFAEDQVIVYLKKSASKIAAFVPDFSCIDYVQIEESSYHGKENDPNFTRSFVIYLNGNTKENVLSSIQKLEKLEYVQSVSPNFIRY